LTLGKNIPDAKINNVIHECGLEDMVAKLPNGLDTVLSDQGKQLSGGQKQRISFAREILRDKPIYLLDEATSALDNVTEKLIQNAFESLSTNKTTITIAHRLTTIKNSDTIIVLGKEGIIEKGNHQQLMNLNGVYAKMYNSSLQE